MRKNFSIFSNHQVIGKLLLARLIGYKSKNCSIISVSKEALAIANYLKKHLEADSTFLPVELIKDPVNPMKSIGEVSFDFTLIHAINGDIPQSFIYHQGRKLRADLIARYPDTYRAMTSRIKDRIVIVVVDATTPPQRLIACLKSIRRQKPSRIIAVVPVIDQDMARIIRGESDELITTEIVLEEQYYSKLNYTGYTKSTLRNFSAKQKNI